MLSQRSLLTNHSPNPTSVQGHIVTKEKSTVGSLFFGAFPSDRISKAME